MTPPTPKDVAELDQWIAFALDVQVRVFEHRERLIEAGWTEPEAWVLSLRLEERILGPVYGAGIEEDF